MGLRSLGCRTRSCSGSWPSSPWLPCRPSARCWRPRCSWSRGDDAAVDAAARPVAGRHRRARRRRRHGRPVAVGGDQRAARGGDRRACRARSSRCPHWPGCVPRRSVVRRRGRAARGRRPGRLRLDSGAGSDGKLRVVATTTQIGDWARAVGGDRVDVTRSSSPTPTPTTTSRAPPTSATRPTAKVVFVSGDRLDHWMDEVVKESGGDPDVVDLSKQLPVQLPASAMGRGVDVRPALVARPAQRRGGRGRDPRRADAGRPGRRADYQRAAARVRRPGPNARRAGSRAASPRCPPPSASSSPTTTPSATSPRRYGIAGRRRGDPVADDAGPAVGRRARRAGRHDPPRARAGGVPGGVGEPAAGRRDRARRPARASDYTLYGDTLGATGSSGATLPRHGAAQRRRDGARASPAAGERMPDRRPR